MKDFLYYLEIFHMNIMESSKPQKFVLTICGDVYISFTDSLFSHNYYEWESLYKLFLAKHGGIIQMQNYVLRRCLRNRQALEEHYQLSLHSSRQQKWYQFLDNRDNGNKFLKALTEHMPKVTHSYMLHQVKESHFNIRLAV